MKKFMSQEELEALKDNKAMFDSDWKSFDKKSKEAPERKAEMKAEIDWFFDICQYIPKELKFRIENNEKMKKKNQNYLKIKFGQDYEHLASFIPFELRQLQKDEIKMVQQLKDKRQSQQEQSQRFMKENYQMNQPYIKEREKIHQEKLHILPGSSSKLWKKTYTMSTAPSEEEITDEQFQAIQNGQSKSIKNLPPTKQEVNECINHLKKYQVRTYSFTQNIFTSKKKQTYDTQ